MADDIVTRLRLWATVEGEDSSCTDDLNASADEIERLRADRDNFLHLARRLYELIPERSTEALHRANVLRDYEDAVHKELERRLSHD